MQHLELLG